MFDSVEFAAIAAADDGGVVLAHCNRFDSKEFAAIAVDGDFLALAEHAEVGILELVLWLPTGVEASHRTSDDGATIVQSERKTSSLVFPSQSNVNGVTGEDGDVFEHLLTAVAETGSLDGSNLQAATQTVRSTSVAGHTRQPVWRGLRSRHLQR